MKKLLALILCVMMFVSVIPTMAFAADASGKTATDPTIKEYPVIENPLKEASVYEKLAKDWIKGTKETIATAYGTMVADKVVYSTAKGMDDMIVDLVDSLTKKLVDDNKTIVTVRDGNVYTNTFNKTFVNGVKDQVRYLIDEMVATDMAKTYKYTDADGKVDPVKYAQTFSKAVNDALTNKKFVAAYQDVATWAALLSLVSDTNDALKDEYDAWKETIDADFDEKFETRYPKLWAEYIDTFADKADGLVINDPWAEFPMAWVSNS